MRKFRAKMILPCLLLLLATGFAAERIYAYFTTYVTAKGTVPIRLGHETELHEEYRDWEKTISVENVGEVPVFVRVKVICGSQFQVKVTGDKWTEKDGYYYYKDVVAVGETTDSIVAAIEKSKDVISDFNIIVIQECVPAMCDEDGNMYVPEYADWSMQAEYTVDEEADHE